MWVSGAREAEYLLCGYASELIDKIWLPCVYETNAYSQIHGVVAADRSEGRYVWIYVFYRHHIWKCYNIRFAYELIEKIKEYNKLEEQKNKLQRKLDSKKKLITICDN